MCDFFALLITDTDASDISQEVKSSLTQLPGSPATQSLVRSARPSETKREIQTRGQGKLGQGKNIVN